MPTMLSRTIAVFRWTATATIVFVALWSRLPVLEVLRCPYLDAIAVLILSSFRVKEETILTTSGIRFTGVPIVFVPERVVIMVTVLFRKAL